MSIELLTGANYPQWREMVNMGLALFEIDKAIMDKHPVEPIPEEIVDDLSPEVRTHREEENAKLMVIKERISESIRGALPDCETIMEYLDKLES
jgi:hypothetical protein